MGKKIAPASKKPHKPSEKQVNMCVSHAIKQAIPNKYPIISPYFLNLLDDHVFLGLDVLLPIYRRCCF